MTATFYVGDAVSVMNRLPEKSVDLVLTSPPFLALRSYLPSDHPDKALEGGSQATPGAFIDWLIDVVEACDRVLAPHGSLCLELGDTYSGSGGGGGDYLEGGWREGQAQFAGSAASMKESNAAHWRQKNSNAAAWPLPKSLSLIPELFRLTLVYGFNPLTGRQTERWRLRNVVRWVRPNPPVGALGDKFRPATSELMVFCKSAKRYFDLDAVREAPKRGEAGEALAPNRRTVGYRGSNAGGQEAAAIGRSQTYRESPHLYSSPGGAPPLDWWNIPLLEGEEPTKGGPKEPQGRKADTHDPRLEPNKVRSGEGKWDTLGPYDPAQSLGAPPLDWWNIPPGGYEGAHYAVFPPELCVKPVKAMCPEKVCRVCGEPSRRIVERDGSLNPDRPQAARAMQLAEDGGLTQEHFAAIRSFGISDAGKAMVTQTGAGKNSERVKTLAAEAKKVLGGYFREFLLEVPATTGFSDCSHDDWRPGLVLDPFGGSGTTALVATGHGRDAILIDLDERNYDLALKRVGPFILTRGEIPA